MQDDSGRAALQTFTGGKGDVLISYENEAIFAQQNGQDVDYVVPDNTLLIENPAAVTSNSKHPKEAKAFLDFVRSDEAQKIFAENGYRPVSKTADTAGQDFPTPSGLFTIQDLGGWADVATKFFDAGQGHRHRDRAQPRRLGREVAVDDQRTTASGRRRGPPPGGRAGASRVRRRPHAAGPLHGKGRRHRARAW